MENPRHCGGEELPWIHPSNPSHQRDDDRQGSKKKEGGKKKEALSLFPNKKEREERKLFLPPFLPSSFGISQNRSSHQVQQVLLSLWTPDRSRTVEGKVVNQVGSAPTPHIRLLYFFCLGISMSFALPPSSPPFYIRTFELKSALPPGFLSKFRSKVQRTPNHEQRSLWLPLHHPQDRASQEAASPPLILPEPRNLGEELAVWILQHVPIWGPSAVTGVEGKSDGAVRPNLKGLEYWSHARDTYEGLGFHFDKDEGKISAAEEVPLSTLTPSFFRFTHSFLHPSIHSFFECPSWGPFTQPTRDDLVHPLLSMVFYVDDIGGPTVIVDQRVDPEDLYRLQPEQPQAAALCFPGEARLLVFDGSLLHGTRGLPMLSADQDDRDAASNESVLRYTFMINLWEHRLQDPSCVEPSTAADHARYGGAPQGVMDRLAGPILERPPVILRSWDQISPFYEYHHPLPPEDDDVEDEEK